MATSLGVAVLMLVGKLAAGLMTGSAAILSDAAESVIHILATGIAAYALWLSARPADHDHPYGHGKFAYFSSGAEGGLILAAACGILYLGIKGLIEGPELHQLGLGLGIIAALTLINLALGLFLIRTGKHFNSLVLVANGHHVLTDVWTSGAVLLGVALVYLTGLTWLDPLVAILAGLNILRTAVQLLKTSIEGLTERAAPEDTRLILDCLQSAVAEGHLQAFHQLRHRRVNDELWIDLHLLFPHDWTITAAHDQACEVEARLVTLFPKDKVHVNSHLEPADIAHDRAHPDNHAALHDALKPEAMGLSD
ncbi:cation transporter [bacterium]|nr:cation transporter [bacterium]